MEDERTTKPSSAAPPFAADRLVDWQLVDPQTRAGDFVVSCAHGAMEYLAGKKWSTGPRSLHFACGIEGVAACYLVRMQQPVGKSPDEWLWVVDGLVPSAYFVTDRTKTPADALVVYCELARAWLDVRGTDGDRRTVFPFDVGYEGEGRFAASVAAIDALVACDADQRARDARWVDAASCPRRSGASERAALERRAGKPAIGDLVTDDLGRRGILLGPAPRPEKSWLAVQRDARFREREHEPWCRIACTSGGAVHVPESLVTSLGAPGVTDVAKALHNAVDEQGIRTAIAQRARSPEMDDHPTGS